MAEHHRDRLDRDRLDDMDETRQRDDSLLDDTSAEGQRMRSPGRDAPEDVAHDRGMEDETRGENRRNRERRDRNDQSNR